MTAKKKTGDSTVPSPFRRVLPKGLGVGRDRLLLRLDFYSEAIIMQDFYRDGGGFRMVSAHDLAHVIASELSYTSGLLPENALWWSNARGGQTVAIWMEPGIRRLAVQRDAEKEPERYNVPLPGLIFICRPAQSPYVYAAARRPAGPRDRVYRAPFPNVYETGDSCAGSHRYPAEVGAIPDSFLRSFFSHHVIRGQSKKYPADITKMWKELDGGDRYPLDDLIYHGTVKDLMEMGI